MTTGKAPSAQEHNLCMIPGPVEFHEDVLDRMGTPALSHVDPKFIAIFGETLEMVRKVLFTQTAQPFVVAGSGTLGWDMVAANLLEHGERALVLNTGFFGDRFAECLQAYGAQVTTIKGAQLGDRPDLAQVAAALKDAASSPAGPYKVITITHVDTSTGVLMDIPAITALVKEHSPSTLVIVDGVCSIGSEELRFDEWGVDVVVTASQKALGCPPGLSIVAASQKAIAVANNRKTGVAAYYVSWSRWQPVMAAYEARKPLYFATPAVQTVVALHESLRQLLAVGMDKSFAAHHEVSKKVKTLIAQWGLKFVPTKPENLANGLTVVYYPDGLTAADILPKMTAHGVVIAGGLHPQIATKYFRIGHLGLTAYDSNRKYVERTLDALHAVLQENGVVASASATAASPSL